MGKSVVETISISTKKPNNTSWRMLKVKELGHRSHDDSITLINVMRYCEMFFTDNSQFDFLEFILKDKESDRVPFYPKHRI